MRQIELRKNKLLKGPGAVAMAMRSFLIWAILTAIVTSAGTADACIDGTSITDRALRQRMNTRDAPDFACWRDAARNTDFQWLIGKRSADSWTSHGYTAPCDSDRPFAKLVVANFLVNYGLLNVRTENPGVRGSPPLFGDPYFYGVSPATQWHGIADYSWLTSASGNQFHGDLSYRLDNSNRLNGSHGPEPAGPLDPIGIPKGDISLFCPLFDLNAAFSSPSARVGTMIHEAWHAWQFMNDVGTAGPCGPTVPIPPGFHNCTCEQGGHICGAPSGICPTANACDYYYFHNFQQFQYFNFGSSAPPDLARNNPPNRFHSPYQIQFEWQCDVATHPNPNEVPFAVQIAAWGLASWYEANRLQNAPPFTCSIPCFACGPPPPPQPCLPSNPPCTTTSDCPAPTQQCLGGCCIEGPH